MAVCTVCGDIFNNETGFCPTCGAEYRVEVGGKMPWTFSRKPGNASMQAR